MIVLKSHGEARVHQWGSQPQWPRLAQQSNNKTIPHAGPIQILVQAEALHQQRRQGSQDKQGKRIQGHAAGSE